MLRFLLTKASNAKTAINASGSLRSLLSPVVPRHLTRAYSSSPEEFFDDDYYLLIREAGEKLSKALTSPTRFQSIEERKDHSDIPESFAYYESLGKYITKYRGAFMFKNCFELSIYYQLFSHLKPKVVIELGTFTGASAMWYADTAKSLNVDCCIYSLDDQHVTLSDEIKQNKPDTVNFIEGSADNLTSSMLQQLPHPWLVVNSSHKDIITEHLSQFMESGDYLVIEDTKPNIPIIKVPNEIYNSFEGCCISGKHRLDALNTFLQTPVGKAFKVDSFYTDFYGYNCTWNWHSFLKRC